MEKSTEIQLKNEKILPPAIFEISDSKTAYCRVNKNIRNLLGKNGGKHLVTSIQNFAFVSAFKNKKKINKLRRKILKILKIKSF